MAAWSFTRACCLFGGVLSASRAAQLDDACALPQATAHLHQKPDGKEIVKRLKERMLQEVESSGLEDALASFSETGFAGGGAFARAGAQQQQQLAVDLAYGIRFNRLNSFVEEGSSLRLELDRGCAREDSLGSNNCTLHANENVHVRMSFKLKESMDERSTIYANFTTRLMGMSAIIGPKLLGTPAKDIKNFRTSLPNVTASCPMCGSKCKADLYGMKVDLQMPDCPIPAGQEVVFADFDIQMPRTEAWRIMQSRVQGTFGIRRPDGSTMAETTGRIKAGKLDTPCPPLQAAFGTCEDYE